MIRAGIHEEDLVDIVDRVQPVGDDDPGCRGREFEENFLEKFFGDRIDVGGCFVQNQQFRPAKHGAHKSDELLLAQADAVPAGRDRGIETFREAGNQG